MGCLPGASLDDDAPAGGLAEGAEVGGRVALRLGPVSSEFRGVIRVLELDRGTRRLVLGVRADDERGNGSASATTTLAVEPDGSGSRVDVGADIEIRGRVASFGAGAVERVSARMVDQFAANLTGMIAGGNAAQAPPRAPASGRPASAAPTPVLGISDLVPADAWPVLATGCAFLCGFLLGRAVRRQRPAS